MWSTRCNVCAISWQASHGNHQQQKIKADGETMQLPCWCSSAFVTGCIAQTNGQLWDKPGCETTMCPFSSAVQVWASTVGPGWLWRDLPRVRANAQALLMKQLWCFTPHKFVYWPHSASGRQMWNNKTKDTFLFLCHLVANIFTPRSTTSAKQPVCSSQHGALVLARQMANLWPPHTSSGVRTGTEQSSVPELDIPRTPTLLEKSVVSKY